MKFDFKEIKFTDIDGSEIQDIEFFNAENKPFKKPIHKVIADIIWKNAPNLLMHETSLSINRLESFELTNDERNELRNEINNLPFVFYLKKPMLDYINNLN